MSLVVTDVVALHAFDYLESSRIIRFATRELGVQSVIARGARRPRSRFGSSLDVFASGVAQFHARPGRDLHTLSSFDITRSRVALAEDLDRFRAASALVELALAFMHPDPHDTVFDVLAESLDLLLDADDGEAVDLGIFAAWRMIAALGFAPTMAACCVCGRELPRSDDAPFSHAGGGVVCSRCRAEVAVSRTLPANARQALDEWLGGTLRGLAGPGERRAHVRLLREFLQQHLSEGRELRALAALESSQRRPE